MRIAAIGLGNRLSGVYRHQIRKLCPEARLVGLLDPDAKAVERLPEDERGTVQRFDDLAAMLAGCRPDAVMVGTRCDLHARYATALGPVPPAPLPGEAGGHLAGGRHRPGARLGRR